jgi:RNA polymerase sigma-70 factor (ECF subfamily)
MATAPRRERADEEGQGVDLARLFDETLPRVFGYFRARVGGDRAVAEDLTQESYLAAARAIDEGRAAVGEPVSWLFGIARHKLIDHYRARELTENRRGDWDEAIAEIPGEIEDLERIVAREELIAALATLPAGQRLALVLHYADGLSVAEVASALGRSEHAVESLLARGRRALRARLIEPETRA